MSLRNLMALSACSVSSATSSSTVCSRVAERASRHRARMPVPLSSSGVDALQFFGQQIVVVAEFEQLRIGILQQLNRGISAPEVVS